MQRTLNGIIAELSVRRTKDAALQISLTSSGGADWVKEMDANERIKRMDEQDQKWEKECDRN